MLPLVDSAIVSSHCPCKDEMVSDRTGYTQTPHMTRLSKMANEVSSIFYSWLPHFSSSLYLLLIIKCYVIWSTGAIYESTKSYDDSFYLMGACILFSGLMLYPVPCIRRAFSKAPTEEEIALGKAPTTSGNAQLEEERALQQSISNSVVWRAYGELLFAGSKEVLSAIDPHHCYCCLIVECDCHELVGCVVLGAALVTAG